MKGDYKSNGNGRGSGNGGVPTVQAERTQELDADSQPEALVESNNAS